MPSPRSLQFVRALALISVLLAVCSLWFMLASKGAQGRRFELPKPESVLQVLPNPLTSEPTPIGSWRFTFSGLIGAAPEHQLIEALAIKLGTYDKNVPIRSGRLTITDTDCHLRIVKPQIIQDNGHLEFRSSTPCVLQAGSPYRYNLEIETAPEHQLVAWAYEGTRTEGRDDGLRFGESASNWLMGTWILLRSHEQSTVMQRLQFLWTETSPMDTGIFGPLIGSCLLLLFGTFLLLMTGSRAQPKWRLLGVFCLMLGLTNNIALVTPPFQAPDEPDHVLALSEALGHQDGLKDAERLAQRTHFERIKFRAAEHFSTFDLAEPYPIAWTLHVDNAETHRRSKTTALAWNLARILPFSSMADMVLSMRLFQSVLMALACALGCLMLTHLNISHPAARILVIGLFPTIFFMGMHISDTAYMVLSALVLFTIGSLVEKKSSPPPIIAALLAVAVMLCLTSQKGGVPTAAAASVMLWIYTCIWQQPSRNYRFWLSFLIASVGTALLLHWASPQGIYLGHLDVILSQSLVKMFMEIPLVYALTVSGIGLVLSFANDRLPDLIRRWPKNFFTPKLRLVVRSIVPAAILLTVLLSFTGILPNLPDIERPARISSGEYLSRVLQISLTGFRFADFDWYMHDTLFGGFGWLETIPSPMFISAQVLLLALLTIAFFRTLADERFADGPALNASLLAGLVQLALIMVTAYFCYNIRQNLHGRYMMGMFVLALGFLAPGVSKMFARLGKDAGQSQQYAHALLLCAIFPLHTYTWFFLVTRYFGSL